MTAEYKTKPQDVCVAIGPAAGACCYEVGSEVIEAFADRFANSDELLKPTRENHACINLLQANRQQLVSAGVNDDRIYSAPLCTMCCKDLFFSYRREKNLYGKVGRLMSVIGRQEV
jgi:copper oxidase (laccase) domain-containing protein